MLRLSRLEFGRNPARTDLHGLWPAKAPREALWPTYQNSVCSKLIVLDVFRELKQ